MQRKPPRSGTVWRHCSSTHPDGFAAISMQLSIRILLDAQPSGTGIDSEPATHRTWSFWE
jgi:hypothetical protein